MNNINVLVTSVGGFSHGSSIVKALLASSVPLSITGVDMSPRLIHSSPLVKKEIVPAAGDERYIEEIIRIVKSYSIDCMFTGSEQELLKISQFRETIESLGVKLFLNNNDVILLCKNKLRCNCMLAGFGFNVPATVLIKRDEDIEKVNFFPVVVKPYMETGASANVHVAQDADELRLLTKYLLKRNLDIIAQEYMPYDDNEYTVGVTSLIDRPEVISSIALRKFIEGPTRRLKQGDILISSGNSQGEFLGFREICAGCETIAKKIGSTGPLNVQLRVIGGKIKPFEINPRFSGTTSSRALNGYNEPEFYIRKYMLNDPDAVGSLMKTRKGFVVKCYEEHYVEY